MPPLEGDLPTNDEGEVVLPDGDTIHPNLFADMEATLLKHRGGEEGWRSRFGVEDDDQPFTPFTARESVYAGGVAKARNQLRSRHARTADESFNAPLAPDYETWRANPNRYDLPGVDTIPDERLRERAGTFLERAQRAGAVHEFEQGAELEGDWWRGSFTQQTRVVKTRDEDELMEESSPAMRPGPVLAHEVGHAVDHARVRMDEHEEGFNPTGFDYFSEAAAHREQYMDAVDFSMTEARSGRASGFGLESDLLHELFGLTRRARGSTENSEYRTKMREIVADALAQRHLEPRAVKRDYPRAYEWLDDLANPVLALGEDGR